MKNLDIKTYGEAADFVNKCDADDVPIYVTILREGSQFKFPVDNYALFNQVNGQDPDEFFPFDFNEDDGSYYLH
jgi:hypothetical protein